MLLELSAFCLGLGSQNLLHPTPTKLGWAPGSKGIRKDSRGSLQIPAAQLTRSCSGGAHTRFWPSAAESSLKRPVPSPPQIALASHVAGVQEQDHNCSQKGRGCGNTYGGLTPVPGGGAEAALPLVLSWALLPQMEGPTIPRAIQAPSSEGGGGRMGWTAGVGGMPQALFGAHASTLRELQGPLPLVPPGRLPALVFQRTLCRMAPQQRV